MPETVKHLTTIKTKVWQLKKGDRIHLKDKNGMYTVHKTFEKGMFITCNNWQAINNHPKEIVKKYVYYNEVSRLAGGYNNKNVTFRYLYTVQLISKNQYIWNLQQ
mgnify:CR=1 FL=1|tara:strand:+ start:633 stop:947 length:315 start_codon:yes stop_codon:yes gene_type:complete